MGRYPFLTASTAYLESVRPYISAATYAERERKLRQLERVFDDFRRDGLIETTSPARFGQAEIGAFVRWMKDRRFGLSYQVKLLHYLSGLLAHVHNPVLRGMKTAKVVHLPRRAERAIYVKDDAWIEEAICRLDSVPGWRAEAVMFALVFYYHTGVRVKELRLARLADLDTARWTFTIEHPKGEGAWASAGETVAVFPSLRPFVLDFLDARARRLRGLGLDPEKAEALIPTSAGNYYSEHGWAAMRLKAFRNAGIEPTGYRVLRPSFAQKLKDLGAPIEAVSRALRHSSTATTERFYARIRTAKAWNELERLWEAPVVLAGAKTG